jgi:hypothetical protein
VRDKVSGCVRYGNVYLSDVSSKLNEQKIATAKRRMDAINCYNLKMYAI